MEVKNLENLSEEILELQEKENERFSRLFDRLANQNEMDEKSHAALEKDVENEVKTLENTSANLKRAGRWSSEKADELKTRLKEGKRSESRKYVIKRAPANSVIDYKEKEQKNFAAGINFYKIAIILISGSFAGVIVELLWCLLKNGYIESRSGLVYGPFNLLYGVGAVAMTLMLYRYRNRSSAISLAGGFLVGSVIEYVLSWGQETLFGSVSWDYSNVPFNLNGRICLIYSFFWGILGVFWIKSIYPRVARLILKIPNKAGKIITVALTVFMIINSLMSFGAVYRWSQRVHGISADNKVAEFFDNRFPDSRMEHIYANMEFDTEKQ